MVLPVFFQLKGGLFDDPDMVFNPGGNIGLLPLPLALFTVFIGIAVVGNYSSAMRTLFTVFLTGVLFLTTSLVLAIRTGMWEPSKLITLAQFLLPLFGMVLGEMYAWASPKPFFERAASVVLLLVLPAQLLAMWSRGYAMAHPDVFFFSIYQHLQYFPMVVAAITIMASMALWGEGAKWRVLISLLWSIAMVQLVASLSIGALVAALVGLICFVLWHGRKRSERRVVWAVALAAIALGSSYLAFWQNGLLEQWLQKDGQVRSEMHWNDKLVFANAFAQDPNAPSHSRLYYWTEFGRGATESAQAFLLGHAIQPDRRQMPSAHNYWLDAVYNFGLLSILPLLVLLTAAVRMGWQRRRALITDPTLLGTTLACAYLILGENMLKVGMRQPYPGLITMFIFGLLISRLRAHKLDESA